MDPDFVGYATRCGVKCSDGRTIDQDAFIKDDQTSVPLVWNHRHNDPESVLGRVVLHNRTDGVFCEGYFNATKAGKHASELVAHNDVNSLSIYANDLIEQAGHVTHGRIREVSLVLAGANPEARIENVAVRHSEFDVEELEGEAVIKFGETIMNTNSLSHADEERTVQDVVNEMTDEQVDVLNYLINEASNGALEDDGEDDSENEDPFEGIDGSDLDNDAAYENGDGEAATTGGEAAHSAINNTGAIMNVFENGNNPTKGRKTISLSHSQMHEIMADAEKYGTLSESVLAHADDYGITNIDLLFPEAKLTDTKPEFITKRNAWASAVLSGVRRSPFSTLRTMYADITQDDARARGYIKGNLKKEEFFGLTHRQTGPTTVYKKQKLDRNDIIDITSFDVVAWIKEEMRIKFDEEIALAILLGDGREIDDEDKIHEDHIRPIVKDHDFFTHKILVDDALKGEALIEEIDKNRRYYKGTGMPTFFTTEEVLHDMLWEKNKLEERKYKTTAELCSVLRCSAIIVVDDMERMDGLLGVLVNLSDYTVGADKGGEINFFDDFDIDFNQYKYLMESRLSGSLTHPKSAMAIWRKSKKPAFSEDGPVDAKELYKNDYARYKERKNKENKPGPKPSEGGSVNTPNPSEGH